uniref:Uncharacterized protein n=1 Tax=Heterorhabditis bacteriophora TaxID=37862 RepID=A0A1I7WS79_HETBA
MPVMIFLSNQTFFFERSYLKSLYSLVLHNLQRKQIALPLNRCSLLLLLS